VCAEGELGERDGVEARAAQDRFDAVDEVARRQALGQRVAGRDAQACGDGRHAVGGEHAIADVQGADRVGDERFGGLLGGDGDEVEPGRDDLIERAADVEGIEAALRCAGDADVAAADRRDAA